MQPHMVHLRANKPNSKQIQWVHIGSENEKDSIRSFSIYVHLNFSNVFAQLASNPRDENFENLRGCEYSFGSWRG